MSAVSDLVIRVTADTDGLTSGLASASADVSKFEASTTSAGSGVDKFVSSLGELGGASGDAGKGLSAVAGEAAGAGTAVEGLTGLLGSLSAAEAVATLGLSALVVGLAAVVGFLKDSAVAWAQQSGILDTHAEAIGHVKDAFSDMFTKVGAALLGGNADIRDFLENLASAINKATDMIAGAITTAKSWIGTVQDVAAFLPGSGVAPSRGVDAILGKFGLATNAGPAPNPQTARYNLDQSPTAYGSLTAGLSRAAEQLRVDNLATSQPRSAAAIAADYAAAQRQIEKDAQAAQAAALKRSHELEAEERKRLATIKANEAALERIIAKAPKVSAATDKVLTAVANSGTKFVETIDGAMAPIPNIFEKYGLGGAKQFVASFQKAGEAIPILMPDVAKKSAVTFSSVFADNLQGLAYILQDVLQSSSVSQGVATAAGGLGQLFGQSYAKAVQEAGGTEGLTKGQKAMGLASAGLGGFYSGYAAGTSTTSTGKGILAGAAAGAAAGSVVPGWGTVIGAGVGAIAGYFGSKKAKKEMQAELADQKQQLLQQYGGMEKLTALADKLGVNIQKAFDAKKPQQFQDAVDQLNTAIDKQNERLKGLATLIDAVNDKSTRFGAKFYNLLDQRDKATPGDQGAISQQLQAAAQAGQDEFLRLGTYVGATFAGLVKESGNAFDALTQLSPAFTVLQDGLSKFGLEGNEVIDGLIHDFAQVHDAALAPLYQDLQDTSSIFTGLQEAGLLTSKTFQTVGADMGATFAALEANGADMSVALALSQPVLQGLWEAQQKYGLITDDTTQRMLTQAEAQGLVGEEMKSVNDKILDVLVAIAQVFGADLPESMQASAAAAKTSAKTIQDAYSAITIPTVQIPYTYTGPEAPVGMDGSISGSANLELSNGDTNINLNVDGEVLTRAVVKGTPAYLRSKGV